MSTFVYAPKINAYLSVTPKNSKDGKEQVIDISEDLVSGSLTLRSSDVHSFSFRLQNAQRKYDGLIRPMDRIVVTMQRVGSPVRVFSGYMDDGPVFSVWPRVLDLRATCTMKRLQFWYWDSSSPDSAQLIRDWITSSTGSPAPEAGSTDAPKTGSVPRVTDGGLRDLVITMLTKIVKWPAEKVHVGAIPADWFSFASQIGDEIIKAADYADLIGNLGGTASIAGAAQGNGVLAPGVYGGLALDQGQADIAATIYNVAVGRQLSARAAAQGIATGIVESSGLHNLPGGDRDSVGVFQQRPSQGWGTVAECMDVAHAAGSFFDRLVKVAGYDTTADFGLACQAVQRSAFPDRYGAQQKAAEAIVAAIAKGASQAKAITVPGAGATIGTAAPTGATGRMMAATAFNLIKANPPGHIRYQEGGDNSYDTPDPRVLDCSSLVDWCYYRTVGRPLITPRSTVDTERPKCTIIPIDLAQQVKGALVFVRGEHVEVSLGNGYSVGAHTDKVPLPQQVNIAKSNGFSDGGLLPGVNYADAATSPQAAQRLQALLGYSCSTSDVNEFAGGVVTVGAGGTGSVDSSQTDVFNSLINVYTWGYAPDVAGSILVGPRALMNDEPILPFISNLMSASMRSWCSAPNGDFMAWFPDYFDLWGIAAKMDVRAIELQDFSVMWSDQHLVTHQYVIGVPVGIDSNFDTQGNTGANSADANLAWELTSSGIATMEFPQIFRALFGQDASQEFLDEYLGRFGGRPNSVTIPSVSQGKPEFFMALFLFMRRWADQFSATVPMTFMPELWPGMILRLPEFNFQAYIKTVVHTFQFGKGGGFKTQAEICAPARIKQEQNDVFGLLPLGGKRYVVSTPVPTPPTAPESAPPLPLPSNPDILVPGSSIQ